MISLAGTLFMVSAHAAPIANPVATFSGLDKITARITNFDVYINETVQFGSLQITPRVCYTRPADEAQRTSVFVEVDQVSLKGGSDRIFTGWMFADSPALNAIDDAVYDFWLVDCKQRSDVPPPSAAAAPAPAMPPVAASARVPAPKPDAGRPPPAATAATPASAPATGPGGAAAIAVTNGSITTLLSPRTTAETSPDVQ